MLVPGAFPQTTLEHSVHCFLRFPNLTANTFDYEASLWIQSNISAKVFQEKQGFLESVMQVISRGNYFKCNFRLVEQEHFLINSSFVVPDACMIYSFQCKSI